MGGARFKSAPFRHLSPPPNPEVLGPGCGQLGSPGSTRLVQGHFQSVGNALWPDLRRGGGEGPAACGPAPFSGSPAGRLARLLLRPALGPRPPGNSASEAWASARRCWRRGPRAQPTSTPWWVLELTGGPAACLLSCWWCYWWWSRSSLSTTGVSPPATSCFRRRWRSCRARSNAPRWPAGAWRSAIQTSCSWWTRTRNRSTRRRPTTAASVAGCRPGRAWGKDARMTR